MMFKSASALFNIELIGKDEKHLTNADDHPWSVEKGMRSTLFLFNYGASAKEVTVRIASGTDVWLTIYTLQPNETRAVSINTILQSRTPDTNKHVLSPKLLDGEIGWWAPSDGPPQVTGRMVQVDAGSSMARNFSCSSVNGLCNLSVTVDPLELIMEDPAGIGGSPSYCEYPSQPTGCPNDYLPTINQATLNWSWSSADTSIAQVTDGATSQMST